MNRGKRINLTLLSVTAYHFTQGINTAKGLSEKTGVSEGRIYKWVKLPEWDKALDDLKFTGERKLHREPRRDVQRDDGDTIYLAEQIYAEARQNGRTEKQAVTEAAKTLSIDRRRINRWRNRFNWEEK